MKYLSILFLVIVAVSGLTGCASESTATSGGDPVPGQAKNSEDRLAPSMGATGPNASVKW